MKIVYIADDGAQFDNEFDCEHYEWILKHPYLERVQIFDKDDNELTDIFSEDTYCNAETVIILCDEMVKDLQDLAKYTGYCLYSYIDSVGIWVYNDDEEKFVLKEH